MKPVLKLLYFKGCPNMGDARDNLREALLELGLSELGWDEVDVTLPDTPKELCGFPSPTILVNGCEIETGSRVSYGRGACRLGGASGVDRIVKGIKLYRVTMVR